MQRQSDDTRNDIQAWIDKLPSPSPSPSPSPPSSLSSSLPPPQLGSSFFPPQAQLDAVLATLTTAGTLPAAETASASSATSRPRKRRRLLPTPPCSFSTSRYDMNADQGRAAGDNLKGRKVDEQRDTPGQGTVSTSRCPGTSYVVPGDEHASSRLQLARKVEETGGQASDGQRDEDGADEGRVRVLPIDDPDFLDSTPRPSRTNRPATSSRYLQFGREDGEQPQTLQHVLSAPSIGGGIPQSRSSGYLGDLRQRPSGEASANIDPFTSSGPSLPSFPSLPAVGPDSFSRTSSRTSTTTSATSRSTSAGGKKRRRTSPVKKMADLQLASTPIVSSFLRDPSQLPTTSCKSLFNQLRAVAFLKGVLPPGIRASLSEALTASEDPDLPEASFYATNGPPPTRWHPTTPGEEADELRELRRICGLVHLCVTEQLSEPAWNSRVHSPLLQLALEAFSRFPTPPSLSLPLSGDADVAFWDVTRAAIDRPYVPQHASGCNLEAKIVDFCLTLSSSAVQTASRRLLAQHGRGPESRSVNHSSYAPLRMRPIGVSIETKTPDGSADEGKAQLSVWAAGHVQRLRQEMTTESAGPIPALPLILVSGSVWQLYFAIDQPDQILLAETVTLGDMKTIRGCYQVLAAVRCLATWMVDAWEPWLLREVLPAVA